MVCGLIKNQKIGNMKGGEMSKKIVKCPICGASNIKILYNTTIICTNCNYGIDIKNVPLKRLKEITEEVEEG